MGVHRPYEWQGARRTHHSFTYLDQVLDALLATGIRPFLELGFMPREMASGTQTVFWWRATSPRPPTRRSGPAWCARSSPT